MKNIKRYILWLLLVTLVAQSTTYETAEDKKIDRWRVLSSSSEGVISNVYDKSKSSRVITFKGEGTKSAYMLMTDEGSSWDNEEEYILHWQMKYSEDFVIIVGIVTEKGKRYLIYTPGNKDGYMQYGLGANSRDGVWHRYSRNLLKDLTRFENHNSINYIESFVIRGDGSIDNVKMMKKKFINKEVKPKKKSKVSHKKRTHKKIKPKKHKKKLQKKQRTNTTPAIYLSGDNPIYLKRGEAFVEPGVRAEDKEDGILSVRSSENIDSHKDGKYSVIYIATDREGNSAVDTRYVIIGEGTKEVTERVREVVAEAKIDTSSREVSEEKEDEEFQLEERELEISEWEKELESREKEIAERERQMQTSMQTQNIM